MSVLDQAHWENRYREGKTGWDIGYASAPIVRYMDGLIDKDLKIPHPWCWLCVRSGILSSERLQ